MPLLPSRSSTRRRRRKAVPAPSGPGRPLFRKAGLRLCSSAPRVARRPMCGASAATSHIGPRHGTNRHGTNHGGSSPSCRWSRTGSFGSTTSAAPPTGLRIRLIRIGAWVVRHARAVTFQPAEAAVGGALFTRILAAIQRLRASAIPASDTGQRYRPAIPASDTGMTVSAIKPGRKRLDGSDPTGAGRTDFRFKPVAAAINHARFTNRMPEPRHGPPRRIGPYAKQRQHDRNGVLIGECRIL